MIRHPSHPDLTRERNAYSILELMIALSLLSILLLLGWSLMQSIQDAETRSWKLTQRIRVLRTTRGWLADDMDHLVRSATLATAVNATSAPSTPGPRPNTVNPDMGSMGSPVEKFEGDATGFVATISPSLDPIRFFDRFMNSSDSQDLGSQELSAGEALLATETELAVREARESLWPERGVDVEYRLEPVNREQRTSSSTIQEAQDIQFELVRREWLLSQSSGTNSNLPSADRELTSADLYRGAGPTDETYAPPLNETRLYGMVQAQFFYFDGNSWSQEWSHRNRGGLPKAVAVCFDFPARADFMRPERSSGGDSTGGDSTGGEFTNDPMGDGFLGSFHREQTTVLDPASQDNALSAAKERLAESLDREVVIIVETGNRNRSLTTSQTVGVTSR